MRRRQSTHPHRIRWGRCFQCQDIATQQGKRRSLRPKSCQLQLGALELARRFLLRRQSVPLKPLSSSGRACTQGSRLWLALRWMACTSQLGIGFM